MNLYLVRSKKTDRDVWIAAERDGRMWVYLPNTGDFRVNRGLTADWLFDRDLDYQPLSTDAAAEHIAAGVIGRLDGHRQHEVFNRLRAADAMPVEAVLAAMTPTATPNRQQNVRALAAQIAVTAPGVWTTYRTYPPAKKASAHRAASDVRHGRVKAFRGLELASQVTEQADGDLRVELTRAEPAANG